MPASLRLRSSIPGRQRWEAPGLRDRPRLAIACEEELRRSPQIHVARADFRTGRILVLFDPALSRREMVECLRRALAVRPMDPEAYAALQAARSAEDVKADQFLGHLELGGGLALARAVIRLARVWLPLGGPATAALGAAGWALGIAAILAMGTDHLRATWRTATGGGRITTGTLVGTATLASVALNEQTTAIVVLWLLNLGEHLEIVTLRRARREIRALLAQDEADTVWLIVDGVERRCAVAAVSPGDRVVVHGGERIPVDGRVAGGQGSADQSAVTGESLPVHLEAGVPVYAGTLLVTGEILVLVEKVGDDTVVGRLIERIEQARHLQPRIQTAGATFSRYVVPSSFFLSLLVLLLTGDPSRALTMLLVVCPCAAGLATPTAVRAAIGNGASRGILVKGGAHLETLAQVDVVLFDKTGTLTEGTPALARVLSLDAGYGEERVLALAACAERHSHHPLSVAILSAARERGVEVPEHERCESLSGLGMVAEWADERVLVGSPGLLRRFEVPLSDGTVQRIDELAAQGESTSLVAHDGRVVGLVSACDRVRPGVRPMLDELRHLGIERFWMITGDHPRVAEPLARDMGIGEWRAGLLPDDKFTLIRELQASGHRVAMVGDGINDAPALTVADVGIAMGARGSDAAIETADIALASDRLSGLAEAVRLSRATLSTIRLNYGFALGINGAGLLLGALGTLHPIMAAVLHNVGTVLVVLNSGRLVDRSFAAEKAQPPLSAG
jgi:cation-transporting P-type ATPase C